MRGWATPLIRRLGPAVAHALPQQPRDLGDVGVGVGIVGAAADDEQQRVDAVDLARGAALGGLDAVARASSSLGSIARSRPYSIATAGFSAAIAVELPRHVVLDVAGGEQHAGHRQHARRARGGERVEAFADGRPGELEEGRSDARIGKPCAQAVDHRLEFDDCLVVAAAMAAHQDGSGHIRSPDPLYFI